LVLLVVAYTVPGGYHTGGNNGWFDKPGSQVASGGPATTTPVKLALK